MVLLQFLKLHLVVNSLLQCSRKLRPRTTESVSEGRPSVNPDNSEPAQTCSHSGTILVAIFARASHTHTLIT